MALVLKDRVKVLATTTGTGTFTLGAAVAGFQDFSVIGNGNTTYYTIVAQATPDWEVGIGTYTASGTLLSRDTILESSNGGAAVDFPAGTKDVFVTYPAERATYLDTAGSYPVQNTFNTLNAANAVLTAGTVSTTPLADTDIANKLYVDNLVASGIHFHAPVRVESPTALTVTYNNGASGVGATLTNAGTQVALVIDGVTVSVNDRVLIYTQADATQNGVYVVTSVGSGSTNWVLTRSDDTDSFGLTSPNTLGEGSTFFVQQGDTGAGETYTCNTVGTITFGTTNITFAQISSAQIYSAGTGLTLSGTQFSLSNTGTAGTYGSASQVPVFTTNAQGQVTAVTDTAIAIAAGAVSGLAASATTDTTNASNITTGTLLTGRLTGSYTGVTGVGTLTAGTWNGSTIDAVYGGTGLSSFVAGDIIYADSSTTLARLADVAVGNALISGGASADPSWGKIGLATHVDGTLPIANGGTNGAATPTAGGVAYGNGTAYAFSSAGTSGQVLTSSGTGAPSWTTLSSGTVTNVTGTLPISVATGTTTPVVSISQAATASDGYLSSTDWNTFNNKTSNTGTVTSVGGTGTVNGLTLTGTVTTSGNLTLGGTLSGIANAALTNSSVTVNGTSIALGASGTITANNPNALTINNGGAGGASGTTYNGSSAITISYNTVGAPSTTGTNASGTWGISVTGNAATAGALQNNGTGASGSIYSDVNWSQLMQGFTTGGAFGWRATSATAVAFSCTAAGVFSATSFSGAGTGLTGTASSLSIGGNAATITSQANSATITASTTAGSANTIVRRDGNGYIFNNYFNSTDNSVASGVTAVMVKQGDSYLRSGTAASIATFISGQAMNISGSASANLLLSGGNMSGLIATVGNTAAFTSANDTTLSVRSSGTGTAASMSFHRPGAYAINLGLDTDNIFKLGGWSAGGVQHYWDNGGNAFATSSMRAQIFYDLNDTAYYCDPRSNSVLLNINGRATNNLMFYEGFTLNADTMSTNATGFTYSVNAPYTGAIVRFSTGGGYDLQLNSTYGGTRLAYRNRNGDIGAWYPWSIVTTYGSYPGGDLYAARFYDGENSAYYCDPNSRSIFAELRLNTNAWIQDSLSFNRIYFTQGDGTQIRGYSGTWYIQMGSTSTTTTIIEGAGNFYTTGAVTAYWSDKRLKKNINKIEDWREILSKINGYRFEWNDLGLKILGDSGEQERGVKVGVIAQEAKEALPQSAVVQLMQYESKTDGVLIPKKDIDYDPENPYLTVQMEKYIPVLIEASKGLMDENEQLKATIQSLMGRITALENKGI